MPSKDWNTYWIEKNIKFIGDIYDNKKQKFKTFEQIKEQYLLNNGQYLLYYRIINAIPKATLNNNTDEAKEFMKAKFFFPAYSRGEDLKTHMDNVWGKIEPVAQQVKDAKKK